VGNPGANGTSGSAGTSGAGTISGGTANYVARFTGATTLSTGVLYDNATNVGINTTSPNNALVISNGGAAGFEFTPSNGNLFTYNRSTTAYAPINIGGSTVTMNIAGSSAFLIDSSRNVGIGTTSPTLGRLQVHNASGNTIALYKDGGGAAIALGSTTGPTTYALFESINGGGVRFYTGNGTQTERVRIDVNGNVGIGTTTPNAKLDVNGNTIVTGSLVVTAGITGSLQGTASYALSSPGGVSGDPDFSPIFMVMGA
jgi:hypothetical protein